MMRLAWVVLFASAAGLARAGDLPPPGPDGFVDENRVQERANEYLAFATTVQGTSVLNAIANMERDLRDPGFTAPAGIVDVGDWQAIFTKIETLQDTRDFDGLYLLNALLGYEGHPYVTPAAWTRVREVLQGFKFWITDPTPPMPDPDDPTRDWDESIYWTENHQVLYHTIEYLMGQTYPDACFTITGFEPEPACDGEGDRTGAAHQTRAREFLLRWFDERRRIGWVEWHSNIYYQKDATPLLTLYEYAQDEQIRTLAGLTLDSLLLDLATHTKDDTFGVTHGRSEMKDTYSGPVNDTWGIVHLLFGQQDELGYVSTGDAGATLFARAVHYRMPHVVLEAAHAPGPLVDRAHMSVFVDESAPLTPNPVPPPGTSFDLDSEEAFTFWWGLGAWTVWQVIPASIAGAQRYELENTAFFAPFTPLFELLGDPPDVAFGQSLAQALAPILSLGFLKSVDTYTYRTPDYLLSTAQDYRKGANAAQVHAWQATFSPLAMVFTTHPMNPMQPPSEWIGISDGQPGYWSGTASMPRSAQHENLGIHVYEPLYGDGGIMGAFDYEASTHAWFPQDYFDEVVQSDGWTFGRKGDGYIALWSWRPTEWVVNDPAELALLPDTGSGPVTSPVDLLAPGGADNVWIVECGRAADWETFEAFQAAIAEAEIAVVDLDGLLGFDVSYASPSQGVVTFGWSAPFTVAGETIALGGHPRVDNPWVTAEQGATRWLVQGAESGALLDWELPRRFVTVPEPGASALAAAALASVAGLARRASQRVRRVGRSGPA
jgi:hypothetical protein